MSEILIQCVEAAGRGDTDAMAKLYSKTLKTSYFLAAKLSDSESEAIEIIKKAYARAFCSIDKLKKPEAFEIWLKQIVAAIHKDNVRFVFGDADGNAQESTYDFLPEAILQDERAAERVMEAISKLTPERKTAVILHYYTGMPVSALAKYFGVSESTANAILLNAKADINSKAGVRAPDYPELATLPVLTRLFKDLVSKTNIDAAVVRDIFVFVIEAYDAAKPKTNEESVTVAAEAEEEKAPEETAEKVAEDTAEEDATVKTDKEAVKDEEPAEETAAEKVDAVEATVKAEDVADEKPAEDDTQAEEIAEPEEETVAEEKDGEAEIEDNIVSFRNRINTMLGVETEEEKAEAQTEKEESEEETVVAKTAEEAAEDFSSEDPTVIMTAENVPTQTETPPIEEDAFEKIRKSIDGLSDMADGEMTAVIDDEATVAFADVTAAESPVKEDSAEIKPEEKDKKPATKKSKKSGVAPKIIIAAVAILLTVIVAVVLIVKLNKEDDGGDVRPTTTVAHSDETHTWIALPALAGYSEIEYLNESFSSFKDPDTGKYGLIDYQGTVVLDAEYDGFRRCSNGKYYGNGDLDASNYHVVAEKGGKEYKVVMIGTAARVDNQEHTSHATSNSTTMDGTDYDERDRYYNGYAAVRRFGKWGYVSESGKIVVPYEFDAVNDIPSDDPAAAYDYCRGYANGYVAVKQDGKMGIIKIEKESYEIVVDYEYDMICQGKDGVFLANNGTEWGKIVISSVSGNGANDSEVTTLAPVTEPTEVSIGKYTINSDETNIRKTPNTESDSNIITALDEGYEVSALEMKEGDNGSTWVRFDYNGQDAWVSIKKLDKVG